VCLSLTTFPHYCTDLDATWGSGRGCPLVVHNWVDLQSVHRFCCYDNIAPNAKCQRVLVLTLCLVSYFHYSHTGTSTYRTLSKLHRFTSLQTFYLHVVEVRVNAQCNVAGQGPRCRRPCNHADVRRFHQRK